MKIKCTHCGEEHELDGVAWSYKEPLQWWLLDDEERAKSELSPDWCIIHSSDEGTSFYIRGTLLLPLQNCEEHLSFGVWSSLSEKNFCEMEDTWDDPARTKLGPYFGWFASKMPFVPDSTYLECSVIQREPGTRPLIELQFDHPLTRLQREGVGAAQLQEIVRVLMHP